MSMIKTLRAPETIPEKLRAFGKRNIFVWLAFLVPLALMLTAFGMMDVAPLGKATKQILVTDMWHQYYPFLEDFQGRLQNGEGLFWGWSVGGGVNYFSLMSYYLASPMNFLSFFVSPDYLREFLMISVAVKIALAGSFMAYFLKSVFQREDISLLIFGTCFSFCAFFMGYYWNTIWLDTVAITPLVALGAVKLLTENRFRLYTVMLALSLVTNYYIAYFSCIFILLIFIAYSIIRWQNPRVLAVNFLKFAVFTLLGVGMAAFFLLPTFMALQNTHASDLKFPQKFELNTHNISGSNDFLGLLKLLKSMAGNLINFSAPNNKEIDGLPNVCCGAVPLFFALLSLTTKEIKLREKLVSMGMLIFLFVSFAIRQLDYIWHGFHFPNMIYYRFSYLVSFVIIVMGFRAYMNIRKINLMNVIIAGLLSFFMWSLEFNYTGTKSPDGDGPYDQGVFNMFASKVGTNEHNNRVNRMGWVDPTLAAMAVLFGVLIVLMLLYSKRVIPRQAVAASLVVIVVAQSGYTAYFGVNVTGVTDMVSAQNTPVYPDREHYVDAIVSEMNHREDDNKGLWRAEMIRTSTLNDGALNHYRGLTMFNSMANEKMTIFFSNFGLSGWQAGNRYIYYEGSPVTNLFMNVKYLISRQDNVANTYDLKEVATSGSVHLLENTHFVPNGMIVNNALLNWQPNPKENSYNPFDTQGEFFRLATGINEPVYIPAEVTYEEHTNATVTKNGDNSYGFSTKDSSQTSNLKWHYNAPANGLYLLYADVSNSSSIHLCLGKDQLPKEYNANNKAITAMGYFNKGDDIAVSAALKTNASGSAKVYLVALNQPVFEQAYQMLLDNSMTPTYFNNGAKLEGKIDAQRDGLFLTSVPYEKGWTVYVDGKKTDITPVGDALVAFPITKGSHSITLKYKPNGFVPGLCLSIVCALVFAAFCVFTYVFKKKLIPDFAKDKAFKAKAEE